MIFCEGICIVTVRKETRTICWIGTKMSVRPGPRTPSISGVHPSLPVNSVPELLAYAKANPGKISMASAGVGSGTHMAGEFFKMMAGVNLVHVPYRGEG